MSAYAFPKAKPNLTRLLTRDYDEIAVQTWSWEVEYNQLSRGLFRVEFKILELPTMQHHLPILISPPAPKKFNISSR